MKKMMNNAKRALVPCISAGAGAIGAGYAANLIPIADPKMKAGAVMLLGLALCSFSKKPADPLHNIGIGIFGAGSQMIAHEFGIGAVNDSIMDLDGIDIEGVDDHISSPIMGDEDPSHEMP